MKPRVFKWKQGWCVDYGGGIYEGDGLKRGRLSWTEAFGWAVAMALSRARAFNNVEGIAKGRFQ